MVQQDDFHIKERRCSLLAFSMSEETGQKDGAVVNESALEKCLDTDSAPPGAAGYFSYKWAEVLSADAFSAFEEVGLENKSAVKETGRRFRDTVLALGGGRAPADVFKVQCAPAHNACKALLAISEIPSWRLRRQPRDTTWGRPAARPPQLSQLRCVCMLQWATSCAASGWCAGIALVKGL